MPESYSTSGSQQVNTRNNCNENKEKWMEEFIKIWQLPEFKVFQTEVY